MPLIKRTMAAALSCLLASVLLAAGPLQSAATAATVTDAQRSAALARVADGTWTLADLAVIETDPVLARGVADPRDPGVWGSASGRIASSARTIASTTTSCGWWVDVSFTKKSLLGSVIYKWNHHVQYCRGGGKITKWEGRYDYISQSSDFLQVEDLVANAQSGIGTTTAQSTRQRHLQQCVLKYGCYANYYPWSRIKVFGGGGYSYTGDNE